LCNDASDEIVKKVLAYLALKVFRLGGYRSLSEVATHMPDGKQKGLAEKLGFGLEVSE
jgi:hypothetical protein